jgi:hypothetical protein
LRWQLPEHAADRAGSSDAFSASMIAKSLPGGSFTMILQFSPYELADRLAKGGE